jgi:hypothetical protein
MRIARKHWPKYLREFDELAGVSYGRCVWPGHKVRDNEYGHSHSDVNDTHFGWVCIAYKSYIRNKEIMIHEVAHIFVGAEHGHNATWRKWCVKLGCSQAEADFYIGKSIRFR